MFDGGGDCVGYGVEMFKFSVDEMVVVLDWCNNVWMVNDVLLVVLVIVCWRWNVEYGCSAHCILFLMLVNLCLVEWWIEIVGNFVIYVMVFDGFVDDML